MNLGKVVFKKRNKPIDSWALALCVSKWCANNADEEDAERAVNYLFQQILNEVLSSEQAKTADVHFVLDAHDVLAVNLSMSWENGETWRIFLLLQNHWRIYKGDSTIPVIGGDFP